MTSSILYSATKEETLEIGPFTGLPERVRLILLGSSSTKRTTWLLESMLFRESSITIFAAEPAPITRGLLSGDFRFLIMVAAYLTTLLRVRNPSQRNIITTIPRKKTAKLNVGKYASGTKN